MADGKSFFGSFLDKFKLSDPDQEERINSNKLVTKNDDGAIELDNALSQYLLSIDWSYNNQVDLINTYRTVSNYDLVDYAVDDIVNEMVSFSDKEDPIQLDLVNVELSDNIKNKIYEKWEKITKLLDLKSTIHSRARQFYVDGRLVYQKVIDQKKPQDGLLDVVEFDSRTIKKVRIIERNNQNHTIVEIKEFFVFDESMMAIKGMIQKDYKKTFKQAIEINPDSVVYVTSGLIDPVTGIPIGWLHKAVKPANQLRMMENALVIYRITRAPERRIFYVDTSNMPKSKAEAYMKNLMNSYRNKMSFDPDSGTFKDTKHLQTMQEDYWLPRNSAGRGTSVETLPGGCLAMDTKVSLLDGRELSISDIRDEMNTGKTLWTYSVSPQTGLIIPGLISWAGVTQKAAEVMKLTLDNGEEIICTPDHKFPVYGKGFVRADELSENESMMSLYRKKEFISSTKKLGYEQFFDNESKTWKFTHRVVADFLKEKEVFNYIYENNDEDSYNVRHHKDFNRFNNSPENLCFMSWDDHKKLHADYGFGKDSAALGTKAAKEKLAWMKENDPDSYKKFCDAVSETTARRWKNMSDEEYDAITNKMSVSAINYFTSLTEDEKEVRRQHYRNALKIASDYITNRRKNDPEYNAWFSQRQSSGWTDELRKERSIQTSKRNKDIRWGKDRQKSLEQHKEKQKVVFNYDILNFIIDCIRNKTSHQVSLNDVVDLLNSNASMINQLKELNKDKVVPNWSVNDGFTPNMVKKIPTGFGYKNWADFRRKESVHNHRIVKIERLSDKIEVGTLTIDQDEKYHNYHTFALSCGVFTKNSNLSEIEDVLFFQKRLYKALNIPVSRLEPENAFMNGRGSEITRDELKFSKFVTKVRKRFNMMFLDLLKTEIVLTKIMSAKEWEEIEDQILFIYAQDMYLEEMNKAEMMRDRLDLYDQYQPLIGKYVSNDYIRKEILHQTEEEIKEQDKLISSEKSNKQFSEDDEEDQSNSGF